MDETDFDRGVAAFCAEDYAAAFEIWLPLAEAGDAHAQVNIAVLFADVKGVPQDMLAALNGIAGPPRLALIMH